MKKYLAILVVMAMALTGCTAINNFLNSSAVDFICNPTAEQQADADKMLIALDAAQAVGTIFYPAIGIAKASAVLNTIKGGGCFLVAELKAAFEVVDAANVTGAKPQAAKSTATVLVWQLPEYPSLRVLVEKQK